MVIVSAKEFKDRQKKYFDLAEDEKVLIKRGKKYINLFVTDEPDANLVSKEWLEEFFSIPEEYRCNPFDTSPSGDLFWADRRNVENLERRTAITYEQIREGKYTECKTYKDSLKHLESL